MLVYTPRIQNGEKLKLNNEVFVYRNGEFVKEGVEKGHDTKFVPFINLEEFNKHNEFVGKNGDFVNKPKLIIMNTVPFDYSLIAKGYKVQTTNGTIVNKIHLFEGDYIDKPIVAFVSGSLQSYTKGGKYYTSGSESGFDLVMIPPTKEVYMLIPMTTAIATKKVSGYLETEYFQIKAIMLGGEMIEVELVK